MADYLIIGSDGKEYGPVAEAVLRQWLAEGRIGLQTKVQSVGTPEWKLLSELPGLATKPSNAVPPALPGGAPTPKTSALAVTSLILGVLGVFTCGISALVGLVLGIIALVKISNSRGAQKGHGLALAGTIVSGVFLLMIPIFAAMTLPALAAAHDKAFQIKCVNNEKQLALAIKINSDDNNGHFPPAATWCDAIQPEAGGNNQLFRCPATDSTNRCGYAFNAKLGGLDEGKVNQQTVMIFESDAGWNANGGRELMITTARHNHRRTFIVAFADGSMQQVSETQFKMLRWDP